MVVRRSEHAEKRGPDAGAEAVRNSTAALLRELVAHLRENRTQLREEWVRRIAESKLLAAMTRDEIFAEATAVYDKYVAVLESGSVESLQAYARDLSERIIPRGVETHEVVGIVLLLRDVLARSLFKKYQSDFGLLNRVLDNYGFTLAFVVHPHAAIISYALGLISTWLTVCLACWWATRLTRAPVMASSPVSTRVTFQSSLSDEW